MARIANFPGDNDERQSPLRSEPLPVGMVEKNEEIWEKPLMDEFIDIDENYTGI